MTDARNARFATRVAISSGTAVGVQARSGRFTTRVAITDTATGIGTTTLDNATSAATGTEVYPSPLLSDPCDNLTFAPWATTAGTPTITAGYIGNGISINTTASIAYNVASGSQTNTLTAGCWIKFSALPGSYTVLFRWRGDAGATTHDTLQIYNTNIAFFRTSPATVLGSGVPHGMTIGNWYYLEVSVLLSDTVGVLIARINGTTVLNVTGQDTKSAGTATVFDQFGFVGGASLAHIVDDVYIRNDATFATVGNAAVTTENATASGSGFSGSLPITGTAATTLDDATATATGTETFTGTVATTLADATGTAVGTVSAAALNGQIYMRVGGTFVQEATSTRIAGTFVDKPLQKKVAGVFSETNPM